MSLGPRKTLYVVSTGSEKFLIAGDIDRTSLISKLNSTDVVEESVQVQEDFESKSFKSTMESLPKKHTYMDRSAVGIKSQPNKPYSSVMKNLLYQINNEDFTNIGGGR